MPILAPPTGPVYVSSSDIAEAETRAAELEIPAPTFAVVATENRVAELRIGPVDDIPTAHLAIQDSVNKINELIRKEPGTWNFRGGWVNIVKYKTYDVVIYEGQTWLALLDSQGEEPDVASPSWTPLTAAAVGGGGGSGGDTLPLDIPPTAGLASALDDEFSALTLNPLWTPSAVTANAMNVTLTSGWANLDTNFPGYGAVTGKYWGMRQNIAAGSFTVSAKVAASKSPFATIESYDGLMVGTSGGADKGHSWGIGTGSAQAMLCQMGATTYNEGASDWSGYDGFNAGFVPGPWFLAWFRLRYDLPSTTLFFDYSLNGKYWNHFNSRGGVAQPNRVGIGQYCQNGAFRTEKAMAAAWFRVKLGTAAFTKT